jgi:hypothetical protein
MSKKKTYKTHFRKPNGASVCNTTNPKAVFVQKFAEATCMTCQSQYRRQRGESKAALKHVVQMGALSDDEIREILDEAIKEEAIKQVMDS